MCHMTKYVCKLCDSHVNHFCCISLQVYAYLQSILNNVVPDELWGCVNNKLIFFQHILFFLLALTPSFPPSLLPASLPPSCHPSSLLFNHNHHIFVSSLD